MVKIHHQLDRFQYHIAEGFYAVLKTFLSLILGFLIAKCELFDNFSPFSLIFLSVSPGIGLIPTFCYIGSSIGIITNVISLSVFKYITALTMIYIIHMVFRKSLHIIKNDTAILSASCCFLSGFLFLLADRLSLFGILALLGESLLVCCCIYFVNYAVRGFRQSCFLSSREIISAVITLVLIIVALHNAYIFSISIARVAALSILFLSISCLKTGHTAVLGSCLAIMLAAIGNGGEAIFTAVVISTLVGCVFSSFSERFSLISFIMFYYATLFFFGKFPWHYWYFLEPLLAYSLIFFIPKKKLRFFLSAYIPVKNTKKSKENSLNTQELLAECQIECRRVCKNAEKCYEKHISELSDGLEAISETYIKSQSVGNVRLCLPFCIKPHTMTEVLERKLAGRNSLDFEALIDELEAISKRIEQKMDYSVQSVLFFEEDENKMKRDLEKRRIKVNDINLIVDEHNSKKCTLRFQPTGDILYEKIICEIAAPYFAGKITAKISQNGEEYVATIKEKPNYEISCSALCKARNGEQTSGDSALGFSAGNFYYLILADGMGSGNEAKAQSKQIIDSMRRLLSGGLSVENAVNVYRSTLRFRQSNYFTTADICAINLDDGTVEFYKSGAYDSFYLSGEHLEVIKGGGIPLGLSDPDRLDHIGLKTQDGDFLILASDGLSALQNDLKSVLLCCKSDDPRVFAKSILRALCERCNSENTDDVTVMICKISKSTE